MREKRRDHSIDGASWQRVLFTAPVWLLAVLLLPVALADCGSEEAALQANSALVSAMKQYFYVRFARVRCAVRSLPVSCFHVQKHACCAIVSVLNASLSTQLL